MLPSRVEEFLQRECVRFRVLGQPRNSTLEESVAALGVAASQVARAVLLRHAAGFVLAILPTSHTLDLDRLQGLYPGDLTPVPAADADRYFPDCEPGAHPPLGEPYALECVVDDSLAEPERVCFEPGVRGLLVEVSSDDFQFLLGAARRAAFARPLPPGGHPMPDLTLAVRPEVRQLLQGATAEAVQERLSRQYRLPTMPGTAVQMLALAANPNVKVSDLAGVIRLDPSLAAQVVRYARSPFFAYRGKVESIEDAITRVLGLDMVLNLAVGIAVGKSLRIPRGGPLGIEAFWRHSVYAAALAQGLSKGVPRRLGARPGMAYLTGLLHNLGFLLLGHLFQPEFYLLNKLVLNNPDVPVTALEDELFGMDFGHQESPLGHARLGGWLMQRWQMPPEVVVTVREHHHADYAGEHAVYVRLVQVANHLLKRAGLGDAPDPLLSLPLLHSLELSEAQVLATFESVSEAGGGLDVMAQQLAA